MQGFWSGGDLRLWAEDSDLTVKSPSQALRAARPHPFAAPAAQVSHAIGDGAPPASDGETAAGTAGGAGTAELRLPSLRSSPLDSPELIRLAPRRSPTTAPVLLTWTVPVVRLDPVAALNWLTEPAESEARLGASITYLRALARFARELTERGRVLPAVRDDGGDDDGDGPIAYWRPVLQGPDILAYQNLVTAMPPVCRAGPGMPDSRTIVERALHVLVDTAVRGRLPEPGTLLPSRRGRKPKVQPVAEAWLGALTGADGRFLAADDAVGALSEDLQPWAQVGAEDVGPARATFRLIEPGDERTGHVASGRIGPDADGAGEDWDEEDGDPEDWDTEEVDADELGGWVEHDDEFIAADAAPEVSTTAGDGDATARAPSSSWRVEFLLQSTEDPSLLIPAEQAWDDTGTLRRWIERPQELLLTELGRASRLYSTLAEGLRQARPGHLDLDAEGAFEFLTTAAPALDEAGFGVLLPNWWARRRKLGLKMSASTPSDAESDGRFGREQLCDFQWQLAVGDEALTAEEIEALVAAKAPLVRVRGQWVSINPEQLRQGLDFLDREGQGETTAAQVLALAATHPEDSDLPLEVTGIEADGWLGALLEGTAAQTIETITPPAELNADLRPYQQRGLSWLTFLSRVGLGACLADDMGLGKTLQVLALEATERAGHGSNGTVGADVTDVTDGTDLTDGTNGTNGNPGPTLLLCPTSLVSNWQAEAKKFAPHLRLYAHHGKERLRGEALVEQLESTDVMITTYATGTRDMDELAEIAWNRVVLDEAQAIKNRHARTTKAMSRLRGEHRIALTGTPVENRLGELWSIMNFLNPGLLGSAEVFRTRYAIPVERHADDDAAGRLRQVTRPYLLRRVKTDPSIIDDLPEKIEVNQYYRLTTEQASLYQSVVDDMMDKIEDSAGIERRGNVLAAMTKLKQVCNHPAQLLHERSAIGRRSGKVIRLEEIVEEIMAEGDRALLFTQYAAFAEMMVPHLAARFGTDVLYLHGKTPRAARAEMVERFQSGEGPPLFVLSLRAGGTGLNLTAANHVIHLDRWWNPAVENQATDRAFRIGQKRNVQVRKFIGTGTLEEKIDTMLHEKAALADLVVRDGESWLTELSTGDLRDLFALSEGAVGE